MSAKGKFCWYDLNTTDPDAAGDFYKKVVGWGEEIWEGEKGGYPMWKVGDKAIGGRGELAEEAKAMGAPPHWLGHISTDDIQATVAKAKELGGNVFVEPFAIPSIGQMSVLADPTGATFSVFQPEGDLMEPPGDRETGAICWNELMTGDLEASWTFFSTLFGWDKTGSMDMGPGGEYRMFGFGETSIGGMTGKPDEMPVSAWCYYAVVPSLDKALVMTRELGGQVTLEPMEIPGGDTIAVINDAQGAFLGFLEYKS